MAISDNLFQVEGKTMHFFDVSGLTHHRKAWIPYFDKVHSVLYVASLSSYDKKLIEDNTVNQLTDSLVLFEQISNHPLLQNIDFILFLNKKDLYTKKIKKTPLSKYFPEFEGTI